MYVVLRRWPLVGTHAMSTCHSTVAQIQSSGTACVEYVSTWALAPPHLRLRRDAWARWPWPATTAGAFASATWRPSQSLRTCARACSQGRIQGETEEAIDWSAGGSAALHAHTERTPTGLISMRAGAAPSALRQRRGGNGISPGNFVWGYGHRWRAAAADTAQRKN